MYWVRAYGVAALAALSFAAAPARAGQSKLTVTGAILRIAALKDSQPTATPQGVFGIGEAFSLTATFDLDGAQLTSTFDADPTVNIYYLPGTKVTLTIGGYSRTYAPSGIGSSLQLWDNRVVVNPVDAQSFSFFDYPVQPASAVPFDLGPGAQSISADFLAFDNSATARTNDLVSQIAPLSAFATQIFQFGQLNQSTGLFVLAEGRVASATLNDVAAVPEPSTWVLMILGFAGVGGVARRRRDRAVAFTGRWRARQPG